MARKGKTGERVGMKSSSVGRAELYPPVAGLVSQPHARVQRPRDEAQPLIQRYADTFRPPLFPKADCSSWETSGVKIHRLTDLLITQNGFLAVCCRL